MERTHVWARRAALAVIGIAAAIGSFALGRTTAPPPAADTGRGFTDGYQAGRADGVQEGRALQVGQSLGGAAQSAFASGYVAGLDDAFGGYDGGWSLATPYLITLDAGTGGATYRIASRIELRPGVSYYLCPDGTRICQR
jgi:hypothetical protein